MDRWKKEIIQSIDWSLYDTILNNEKVTTVDGIENYSEFRNGWYYLPFSEKLRHYVNGTEHHDSLPSVITSSTQFWFSNGKISIGSNNWSYAFKDYKGNVILSMDDTRSSISHNISRPIEIDSNEHEDWYLFNNPVKNYVDWCDETGIDLFNITSEDEAIIHLKWNES